MRHGRRRNWRNTGMVTTSAQTGVSRSQPWKYLRADPLPREVQEVQQFVHHNAKRAQFSTCRKDITAYTSHFVTDDANVTAVTSLVQEIAHMLALLPHKVIRSNIQHRFSVKVWSILWSSHVAHVSHFTAASCRHILETELQRCLKCVPLQRRR